MEEGTVAIRAEYIWIDGTEPTQKMRSKTKILKDSSKLPIWGLLLVLLVFKPTGLFGHTLIGKGKF